MPRPHRPPKFLRMNGFTKSASADHTAAIAVASPHADDRREGAEVGAIPSRRLLDRVRDAIRLRRYSIRTEDVYVDWARRFILFHGKRHPESMGAAEVEAFLTYLATERGVAASTQNLTKSALLFLYKEVLGIKLPWLDGIVTARHRDRLPVVLTSTEVRALLHELNGRSWLVAALLYGTGMRLLEGLRLRVKDVDF
jgi:integrase